jgi:hypothetical protein
MEIFVLIVLVLIGVVFRSNLVNNINSLHGDIYRLEKRIEDLEDKLKNHTASKNDLYSLKREITRVYERPFNPDLDIP